MSTAGAVKAQSTPTTGANKGPVAAVPNSAAIGPQTISLKRGQIVFMEGDSSRAMYLVKSGMIRIFKKKGDSSIELDTIRSGQIFGELAFLDGLPRSASCEALVPSELVEISGPTFTQTLSKMPEWVKVLLKTVVGRLRAASNKIRTIEATTQVIDYTSKDGKKFANYTFLGIADILKVSPPILLGAFENRKPDGTFEPFNFDQVEKYAVQMLGQPASKLTAWLEILNLSEIVVSSKGPQNEILYEMKDVQFLLKLLNFLNEQNQLEAARRVNLSTKGFLIMNCMAKHLDTYPKNEEGKVQVNVIDLKVKAEGDLGKEVFSMTEFDELVRVGYLDKTKMPSESEIIASIAPEPFLAQLRIEKVLKSIDALNEQKRKF